MSIPSNPCRLIFSTMTGRRYMVDVDKNATTDELISSIATAINVSKDKIMLNLDLSLDVKGHMATQENAKEVDAKVQEQFESNIIYFIESTSTGIVVVKR